MTEVIEGKGMSIVHLHMESPVFAFGDHAPKDFVHPSPLNDVSGFHLLLFLELDFLSVDNLHEFVCDVIGNLDNTD